VEAVIDNNACLGFLIREPGKPPRRVDFGFKGSGTLVASRDGRTVVMIQSYLYGRIDPAGELVELTDAGERKDPVGIYVFRDGKLIATHRIRDLLVRKRLVEPSTSHVTWVRELPAPFGDRFTITTTSFRTISFDARTGRILRQEDAPEWNRCAMIVTGKVDLPNGRLVDVFSHKTWTHLPEIRFTVDKDLGLTNGAHAKVCLERKGGRGGLRLTQQL